jgi:hypothetical protein
MSEQQTAKTELIKNFLQQHQQATLRQVSEAIGRTVYGPEMSKARKELGITYVRTGRPPQSSNQKATRTNGKASPKQPSMAPVMQVKAETDSGTLVIGLLGLAKEHGGFGRLKKAVEALESIDV